MPELSLDQKLKLQLGSRGYAVQELPGRSIPKRIFYNREGAPLLLPADPISMKTYLGKGFKLEPNGQVRKEKE